MDIGPEQDPIEMPIPLDPAKVPIHEPAPVAVPAEPTVEPAKEPAHAGWNEYEQLDLDYIALDYIAKVCRHG